jgi:hypothetical protein
MNDQTISRAYANDIIFALEKAFWDERGKGARFRVTTVGSDFYRTKCLPGLQSVEIDGIVQAIERALQEEGIVKRVSAAIDGRLLRVRIEGCAHRSVEDRLVAQGTKPFTCVPANLIVLAIEEKLDRPVELAEIKLEDGACQILLVLFEQRPVLG